MPSVVGLGLRALGFREVACWVMGSRVREAGGFRRFRV